MPDLIFTFCQQLAVKLMRLFQDSTNPPVPSHLRVSLSMAVISAAPVVIPRGKSLPNFSGRFERGDTWLLSVCHITVT